MFEKIMRNIEWVTIPLGGMALILSLLGHDSLAGFGLALCVLYLIYAVILWAVRPKFD